MQMTHIQTLYRSVHNLVRVYASVIFTHAVPIVLGVLVCASAWAYAGCFRPPASFPVHTIITIGEGASVQEVATMLASKEVVQSSMALILALRFYEGDTLVKAGDYYFSRSLTLTEVAERLMQGDFGLQPVKVTIPEGATTYEIAEKFSGTFVRFDAPTFLLLAERKEGYLFPDTYLFLPNATAQQVIDALERNFYEKIETLGSTVASSDRSLSEIVTMASLLEKEASDHEERRKIAGVLWRRIEVGMPLQVDAVFGYINATSTFSPRYSDLEVDSPYNTYLHKGLPPGPIANPGLSSLEAALTPLPTDALYYLHGNDGRLHIARTFDEHVRNKHTYLR